MVIAITGGTGFIGSRMALNFLERGHQVRIIGLINNPAEQDNAAKLEKAGAELCLVSVTDRENLGPALTGVDFVFHLAAAQHEANAPDQLFYDVNVTGTENMLSAAVAAGVRRFVHGSTIGIYGDGGRQVLDERSRPNPANIYGVTKLKGEEMVAAYAAQIPTVIVRISETYGPGDRRLLKLFRGTRKNRFFMIGRGDNLHHLVYIDDLIEGFWLAATVEEAVGETFILTGKEPVTTNEMVRQIAAAVGSPFPRLRLPLTPFLWLAAVLEWTLRPLGIQPPLHRRRMDFFRKSFAFSIDHAATVLGYEPATSFAAGARQTAAWYLAEGLYQNEAKQGAAAHSHTKPAPFDLTEIEREAAQLKLSARMEQFDSFWEGPEDVEKGYARFGQFYRHNYLQHLLPRRDSRILVVSCGPGYFVNLLHEEGYTDVTGIDSDPEKVRHAQNRGLNCQTAEVLPFLAAGRDSFDMIICEQELNHLTKDEMVLFLRLCYGRISSGGRLIVHGLNGANPITGAEALAQNFDHFNTFTDYSLQQVLEYTGFNSVTIIPLNLYVFYNNPFNYVALAISWLLSIFFRAGFILYGKKNRIFTKKIGAVCRKP